MRGSPFIFLGIICLSVGFTFAQNDSTWDDAESQTWPAGCKRVEIISSLDKKMQPAYFYSSQKKLRPMVISLHTWSGGYDQQDTLSWTCVERDYNYIHPHFRGPNNNFEACGSKYAIQDIDDAISYAIENGKVDTAQIHIIGVSGGGYATLLAYMKTKYPVSTFSAWVPISDLYSWYHESEGRGTKYALDIAKSTVNHSDFNEDFYFLGEEEAIARSPYYMKTPINNRKDSKLYIYAGIHDGYTGSVPVTQSLQFYNKVVLDYDLYETEALISQKDIIQLVASRNYVDEHKEYIDDRVIHYEKTYKDLLKIIVFEGGHEMLSSVALDQSLE